MKIEQTNKRPIKTAGYSSARLHAKRDRKRREALDRAAEFSAFYRQPIILAIDDGAWPKKKN